MNSSANPSPSPYTPIATQPRVNLSEKHVDFTQKYFGVAFLTQTQQREIEENPNGIDKEENWDGIIPYIKKVVQESLIDAYKKSRQYVHAEVCFWCSPLAKEQFKSNEVMIACGTRSQGTSMTLRRFHPAYKWKWVYANEQEQRTIFNFYKRQMGKKYDFSASLRTFTNPRQRTARSGWYCTEMTLSALQLLPEPTFHEHRANCIETDDLYDIVCQSPRCNRTEYIVDPKSMNKMWGNDIVRKNNLQSWKKSVRSNNSK